MDWVFKLKKVQRDPRCVTHDWKMLFLSQVQLRTQALSTSSLTQPEIELMTSRSRQYISCHWYMPPCAKPGDPSQGWAHWHWSHVEPGTALLVRTCQSHGRQQTRKTTFPCWALNCKTAQRRAEEAVQRCAEIYPQGVQHPSWRVASLGPGPAGLEGSYMQEHKALWEKPTTEPGW